MNSWGEKNKQKQQQKQNFQYWYWHISQAVCSATMYIS